MKIVIAVDSFKGTMSSMEAGGIIEKAIKDALPDAQTRIVPISDGGEGLTQALISAVGGRKKAVPATMPNGGEIKAEYGILNNDSAIIEMAAASSITFASSPKDPMNASSFGTGELIRDAVLSGNKTVLLGLGGSACMDGGMGASSAMGVKYLDADGNEVSPAPVGMAKIKSVSLEEVDRKFFDAEYNLCIDVENELCGDLGAANVFGPQKGANKEQIEFIDNALNNFAEVLEKYSGKKILGEPGFGAAGGFALPFFALFNANMKLGIDVMLDACGFNGIIKDADLIITGEGKIDPQSLSGKAPIGVARRAKSYGIPAVVFAGDVELDLAQAEKEGICALFSINRKAAPYEYVKQSACGDLYQTALSAFSFYKNMK